MGMEGSGGMSPADVVALQGRNNDGMFSGNGTWIWVFFLFFLLAWGGNGFGFGANMTSAAAATATFNITQDGEQIAGAKIVSTIAAAGVNNVSCTTLARVYCSDVSSISMVNIGATAIDVSDANMTITRLC